MTAISKLKLLARRKRPDGASAVAPATIVAADEDDLPIPSDIKTVLPGGLFLLGVLAACYIAAEIVLPIVLAFVLGTREEVLLAVTLLISVLTLGTGRTTVLQGVVHLVILATFLFFTVVP